MPFIPHTDAEVRDMLATIGVPAIDKLFDEIPRNLRCDGLPGIPAALNEQEIGRLMSERAARDGRPICLLGAGAYEHHIPSAVWAITTRGEFYSAYTPYQAEASQGTLQSIYEYQTMMASLTGLEVSNARKGCHCKQHYQSQSDLLLLKINHFSKIFYEIGRAHV